MDNPAGNALAAAHDPLTARHSAFRKELESLLNRYSRENESNTPDFILAAALIAMSRALDEAVRARDTWYGVNLRPGMNATDVLSSS